MPDGTGMVISILSGYYMLFVFTLDVPRDVHTCSIVLTLLRTTHHMFLVWYITWKCLQCTSGFEHYIWAIYIVYVVLFGYSYTQR